MPTIKQPAGSDESAERQRAYTVIVSGDAADMEDFEQRIQSLCDELPQVDGYAASWKLAKD